jgi:hypothetical protein
MQAVDRAGVCGCTGVQNTSGTGQRKPLILQEPAPAFWMRERQRFERRLSRFPVRDLVSAIGRPGPHGTTRWSTRIEHTAGAL